MKKKYIWLLLILIIPLRIVIADGNCQEVTLEQCGPNNQESVPNPKLSCYECSKGTDKVYTQAFSIETAEIVTEGNNCQNVEMDSCNPNNKNVIQNNDIKCYKCSLDNSSKYTQALSEEEALEVIGGMSGQVGQERPQGPGGFETTGVRERREINTNVIKVIGGFGVGLIVLIICIFLSKYNNN